MPSGSKATVEAAIVFQPVRLEIRHQQRGSDRLAGYIARDEPEPPIAKLQEIEMVATDRTGRNTGDGESTAHCRAEKRVAERRAAQELRPPDCN